MKGIQIFFLSSLFHLISLNEINEEHRVFDKFYIGNVYTKYKNQEKYKKCSFEDGPFCFQIDKYYYYSGNNITDHHLINSQGIYYNYLNLNNDFKYNESFSMDNISNYYINESQKYIKDNIPKSNINDSPQMKLRMYLTFQSFDSETKYNDILMPETKVFSFQVSQIILKTQGKLRLRYNRESFSYKQPSDYPSNTYGIIESKELFLIFNTIVEMEYFYIRSHKKSNTNLYTEIQTFKEDTLVYSTRIHLSNNRIWTKVSFPGILFDTLKIPGGNEIDNLLFTCMTKNQYNVEIHFYSLNDNKKIDLIKESDL